MLPWGALNGLNGEQDNGRGWDVVASGAPISDNRYMSLAIVNRTNEVEHVWKRYLIIF